MFTSMKEYAKHLYWRYIFDNVLEDLLKQTEQIELTDILKNKDENTTNWDFLVHVGTQVEASIEEVVMPCLLCLMKLKID